MISVLLSLFIILAYIPQLSNIGPVPIFTVAFLAMAAATLQRFRKVEIAPGFGVHALFASALLLSQVGAVQAGSSFSRTIAEAALIIGVPLVALWFYPIRQHYLLILRTMIVLNVFLCWYIWQYGYQLAAGVSRFGPLEFSLNDIGYRLAAGSALLWPVTSSPKRSTPERLLAVGLIAANFYFVSFDVGSRTSFLIQLILPALWFMTQRFQQAEDHGRKNKNITTYLSLAILAVILYDGYVSYAEGALTHQLQRRFDVFFEPEKDSSLALRRAFAKKAWLVFLDHPVVGGGWNNFQYYRYDQTVTVEDQAGRKRPVGDDVHIAHSYYLKVLAETGLVGEIAYLSLLRWQFTNLSRLILTNANADEFYELNGIWLLFICTLFWNGGHDGPGALLTILLLLVCMAIGQQEAPPQPHWRWVQPYRKSYLRN